MRQDCYYIDVESVGFHGLPVLIQYAFEDGPIILWEPWLNEPQDTLDLIEEFCKHTCVFFNAAFDFFMLCKLYTTFSLLPRNIPAWMPVAQLAEAEKDARDGVCVKPADVFDLMLHSRKGEFQTLMARHDIRLTKIPTDLAQPLADALGKSIKFDNILFANQKDPNAPRWKVYDRIVRGKRDEVDPFWKDVVLKFKPSRSLKFLARHCLGLDPKFNSFRDVYPKRESKLYELGYAPYALAVSSPPDWVAGKGHTWPKHIHGDIEHWHNNAEARRYAADDVKYTRMLDEYFGYPESGDDDSVLACMVAAVRWHGYELDLPRLEKLLDEAKQELASAPININAPREVKKYVRAAMCDLDAKLIDESTKRAHLERIRDTYNIERESLDPELTKNMLCTSCFGSGVGCPRCEGTGLEPGGEVCLGCDGKGCPRCDHRGFLLLGPMPCAERARDVLHWKVVNKEIELYSKLLLAKRFHAAFNVIGTLSSRMSGTAGLNAQGIKNDKRVRKAFPLKWDGMLLCGGDFDGFEVTLADAVFQDNNLRADLLTGISIHTLMAAEIYPDKTHEQIMASKALADGGLIDMYTRGKQAMFAFLYGGDEKTINKKLSIPMAVARAAMENFQAKYPGIKRARDRVAEALTALRQEEGIGSKIEYTEPEDRLVTFLGFPRYYTLENRIIKELYELVNKDLPASWHELEYVVMRRGRKQTPAGAVASAIYGAAFNIQSANMRAGNNHLIQSPGAQITKKLERAIWDHQPAGCGPWVVAPMNVHDEVLVVTDPSVANAVGRTVIEIVESYRPQVPLIGMGWALSMESWGEKGKADIEIKPTGITLRDDVYVEPVTIEEMEALDEEPEFKVADEVEIPTDWI